MLSILIPVYNFNIVPLIMEIRHQVSVSGVEYEIIVIDDGSDIRFKEQNRMIREWDDIKYEELNENIGRSKIRNRMAGMAGFPWMLFMDCDTEIARKDYIPAYLKCCDQQGVVCGGRIYRDVKPEKPDQCLHWKYGRKREQKPAAMRNLKPWNSFMTNNFLISSRVFEQVKFDESIEKYGHEDTFFGIELKRKKIPVQHIDNPLFHIGLESNEVFLAKTMEGIENLCLLMQKKKELVDELVSAVKLLRHFAFLKKAGILGCCRMLFSGFRKLLLSNIMSFNPSLLLFDLYKLGFFIEKERTYAQKSRIYIL